MDITDDLNYMEGQWAAKDIARNVDKTTYGTLEIAIEIKQKLVDQFEADFGYTREMPEFDRNYSYNCGILDELKSISTNQQQSES